jgi:hypothetical protein
VVQVFGLNGQGRPFHQSASTIDISYRGARLLGLSCWTRPGEIIGVRCGSEKARFQVVWIGKPNTAYEAQVGLYCLEPHRNIWERSVTAVGVSSLHLGPATPAMFQQNPAGSGGLLKNRRASMRYRAGGRAHVREAGSSSWRWAMICDISKGGCYLEMPVPFAAGKQIEMNLTLAGIEFYACAHVVSHHPHVGMALQFKPLTPLNQQRLAQVMETLAKTQVPV